MKLKQFALLLLVTVLQLTVIAQTDSSLVKTRVDSIAKFKPQFKLGLYYISELNFYGRVDSLRTSGFFPMAEFQLTKAWYVNAAPVFVSNANGVHYGGSVVTTGVRFTKPGKHSTHLYVVKPFYRPDAQIVQSAMKLQVAAMQSFFSKALNITFGGDTKYSDRFDYAVTAGVDHVFRKQFKSGSVLVIDPSAYVNAGTQRLLSRKTSGGIIPGIGGTTSEKEISKFNLLSYEFSIPIVFVKGKILFIANPSYVLPQNLITDPQRPDLSEYGHDLFYATFGVKYSF